MVDVQRGNVFLTIDEEEIEKYMAKGFSVVDAQGRVIRESVPTDLRQLQKAYSEHLAIIKQKDSEIASLKSELLALKSAGVKKTPASKSKLFNTEEEAKPAESADSDGWDEWEEAEEVDEPKPTKKKKKA